MAAVKSLALIVDPVWFEVSPNKSVDVLTAQYQVGGDKTLTHFGCTGDMRRSQRFPFDQCCCEAHYSWSVLICRTSAS